MGAQIKHFTINTTLTKLTVGGERWLHCTFITVQLKQDFITPSPPTGSKGVQGPTEVA